MNANQRLLAEMAKRLHPLEASLVFVGGVTMGLYVNPHAALQLRATLDVDCVVDVGHQALQRGMPGWPPDAPAATDRAVLKYGDRGSKDERRGRPGRTAASA